MKVVCTAIGAVIAVLAAMPAMASPLIPTKREADAAAQEGERLARNALGYPLRAATIYAVANTLTTDPAWGNVDAVVVTTPLERIRNAAFRAAITGSPTDTATLRRAADLPDGWIEAIVFTHGEDEDDRGFAERFGPAGISLGQHVIEADSVRRSLPVEDTYPHAKGDRERYVATVSYRFDLNRLQSPAGPGRIRFTDGTGMVFDLPFAFSGTAGPTPIARSPR